MLFGQSPFQRVRQLTRQNSFQNGFPFQTAVLTAATAAVMADILAALCVIEMVPGRRIVVGAVSSLPAKCLIVNSMQGNCRLSKGDKTLLATSQSMQLTYFLFFVGLRWPEI